LTVSSERKAKRREGPLNGRPRIRQKALQGGWLVGGGEGAKGTRGHEAELSETLSDWSETELPEVERGGLLT
jgi:hypothetical protein